MSFHGGYNEIILFDFWKTESVSSKNKQTKFLTIFVKLYD